jgi:hypothetical protein
VQRLDLALNRRVNGVWCEYGAGHGDSAGSASIAKP